VVFGAGHGGIEAMLLGGLVALSFVNMLILRTTDLSSLGLPPEQLGALQQQVAEYWSAPWPATLLGALERALTIPFHIAMAVVVLQAVQRRNLLWLGLAILLHTATNAVALYALVRVGPYWTEALIAGFSALSLMLLFALKPAHEDVSPPAVVTLPSTATRVPTTPESDLRRKMDDSRFSS
jgi:uncharacterized membrane protein YhfC